MCAALPPAAAAAAVAKLQTAADAADAKPTDTHVGVCEASSYFAISI